MGACKKQYTIIALAALVYKVQEYWKEKKVTAALFIDVKRALDYVLKNQLITKMIKM